MCASAVGSLCLSAMLTAQDLDRNNRRGQIFEIKRKPLRCRRERLPTRSARTTLPPWLRFPPLSSFSVMPTARAFPGPPSVRDCLTFARQKTRGAAGLLNVAAT